MTALARAATQTRAFEVIGTRWRIDATCDSGTFEREVMPQVRATISAYDVAWSRFRRDSLVTRMAQAAGTYRLPPEGAALMGLYRDLYDLTGGAVTPLIGQVLSDAGYDADYSLDERPLSPPPAWDDVMTWDGGTELTLAAPALLDFGAAGKGQLVDLVAGILRQAGIEDFVVDGSGDMACDGRAAVRIGLEDPSDATMAVGVAELPAGWALCGSAGNRRRWGRFHHIIDPHALAPATDVAAVWTVARSAMVADGLSTALFFVAPERLAVRFEFDYVIMRPDRTARVSADFPGTLL